MNNAFSIKKALLAMLLVAGAFAFAMDGLQKRLARKALGQQYSDLQAQLAQTEASLVPLRQAAKEVVESVLPATVPSQASQRWSASLVAFPHIAGNFERHIASATPKVPLELRLPDQFKKQGSQILPAVSPYPVEVVLEGSLAQFATYFTELQRQYAGLLVTRMEIVPAPQDGRFQGHFALALPQIGEADRQRVAGFAKSSPRSVQNAIISEIVSAATPRQ